MVLGCPECYKLSSTSVKFPNTVLYIQTSIGSQVILCNVNIMKAALGYSIIIRFFCGKTLLFLILIPRYQLTFRLPMCLIDYSPLNYDLQTLNVYTNQLQYLGFVILVGISKLCYLITCIHPHSIISLTTCTFIFVCMCKCLCWLATARWEEGTSDEDIFHQTQL